MAKGKMISRWAFFYIISFLILDISSAGLYAANPIRIMNSSANSITIRCEPQNRKIDSLFIDGQLNLRYSFKSSDFVGEPGFPMVPIISTTIGIPANAKAHISILSSNYRDISNVRLLPMPKLDRAAGLGKIVYEADSEIYSSNESYPSEIVKIAKSGFFRDQKIIGLQFCLLQAIPGLNRIRLYDQIIVRLDFSGSEIKENAESVRQISADENLYRGVILNYKQSKAWRVKRTKIIAKRSALFSTGERYKIPIQLEGIYKISGSFLKTHGVDLASIKPEYIKIYNNGGRELPHSLSAARSDSLIENAIIVEAGGDGIFNESDYILFYGQPVTGWNYDADTGEYAHYINRFTEENIYWLALDENRTGKRVQIRPALPQTAGTLQQTFQAHDFSELELNNIYNSGTTWYGPGFTRTASEHLFNVYLPSVSESDSADFKFQFYGSNSSYHQFYILINDIALTSKRFSGQLERQCTIRAANFLKAGLNAVTIQYNTSTDAGCAYIDWFEIAYRSIFKANEDKLYFKSPKATTPAAYQITGFSGNTVDVYDISDFANLTKLSGLSISNNTVSFADSCNPVKPRNYLAITPSKCFSPTQLIKDSASDLRNPGNAADYIIIYHADFEEQANRLAEHRRQFDGLVVSTVDIQDVYDEFSWGLFDPVAIRDFLKFAYYWESNPQIVLLFGDGDYDYKNIVSDMDKNWIPPYETDERSITNSRAMDDWYTYIVGNDAINDLAIGRFTVRSPTEAQYLVDKIIAYDSTPNYGDWKNTITVVADDEFVGNAVSSNSDVVHVQDAENLAEAYIPKTFNVKKIYLMEYPAVKSGSISGIRKPLANEDLINQINRGTLILNYIGHGNQIVWSDERLLTSSQDLHKIRNYGMLPLWYAASCEVGKYDMTQTQSMSEELLAFKDRGAIAVISAAREAFASPNARLNKLFIQFLFQSDGNGWAIGKTSRIGEAFMQAKIAHTGWDENDQKYHIFGDPAMKLGVPRYEARITAIAPDSIKALGKINVKGRILKDGTPWNDYNGKIFLTAFDSKKNKSYTTEDNATVRYILPGNAIFRGPAPVENGQFDMSFIVPKDITYGGNFGRLSLYFWNEYFDGTGKRDSLSVGGTATGISDQDSPEIRIGLKGFPLGSEVFTGTKPILYAEIEDSLSGINITGEIGHTIMLTLDGDLNNRKNATDFFIFDEGSWSKGTFEFPLVNFKITGLGDDSGSNPGLAPGEHTIMVKAWDNSNNSGQAELRFTVLAEDKLVLSDVMNYPNPFSSKTYFTFITNHSAHITIKIYTVAGRLVKTLRDLYTAAGEYNQFEWDGHDADDSEMANGVYIYKIIAKGSLNETLNADYIGRLVIMR